MTNSTQGKDEKSRPEDTFPDVIWLQRDFDSDDDELVFNMVDCEVTWSVNKENETDIKYVRSTSSNKEQG